MIKYRFMLSYMTLEQEGIVSLFLFDDQTKQINSDIVIILMQPLLHLGTVQEAANEGDVTPPARTGAATNQFSELASANKYSSDFKQL